MCRRHAFGYTMKLFLLRTEAQGGVYLPCGRSVCHFGPWGGGLPPTVVVVNRWVTPLFCTSKARICGGSRFIVVARGGLPIRRPLTLPHNCSNEADPGQPPPSKLHVVVATRGGKSSQSFLPYMALAWPAVRLVRGPCQDSGELWQCPDRQALQSQ